MRLKNKKFKKIVVIGGGTGIFSVLSGIKKYPVNLSAIITMADDGGSTGILREEFGILPPGDIRRALIALSSTDQKILAELFNYRFEQGRGIKGHSFGNLFLAALERLSGDFEKAIEQAKKILGVKGNIIPVTLSRCRLAATLVNGKTIYGETNIDIPKHNGDIPIKNIRLFPKAKANKKAVNAILDADAIIIGPGDIYTSILPNLIIKEISSAIKKSKAKKIYIANLMTKFGETNGFKASDFINAVEKFAGTIDYIFLNSKKISKNILAAYKEKKSEPVEIDMDNLKFVRSIIVAKNFMRQGKFIRHDPEKIAKAIMKLV